MKTNTEIKIEIMETILKKFRIKNWKSEYTSKHEWVLDGSTEVDSMIFFTIKGLFGWRLGIWMNQPEPENNIKRCSVFAQHIDNIDKFKPSRSAFCCDFDELQCENGYFEDINDMLSDIKSNPFQTYVYDGDYNNWRTGSTNSFFLYLGNKFDIFKTFVGIKVKDLMEHTYFYSYMFVLWIKREVHDAKLVDMNDSKWHCSPRFSPEITVLRKVDWDGCDEISTKLEKLNNIGYPKFFVWIKGKEM